MFIYSKLNTKTQKAWLLNKENALAAPDITVDRQSK